MRWVFARRVSAVTPPPPGWSHPMSAHPEKSAAVLPTWMDTTMPRRTAALQTTSQSGCPGGTRPGALEFADRVREVAEIDDGHAVEAVGVAGQLLAQVVVAPRHRRRAVGTEELEHLPVPARVHQAVVDPDTVHPRHAFARARVVHRVEDDRPPTLFGQPDEGGEQ